MVFSSLVFLCIFLPAVFLSSLVFRKIKIQNGILLAASLLFYAYGEPVYVLLMLASAFANYGFALLIGYFGKQKRVFAAAAIVWNIGILILFKYTGFLVTSWNQVTGMQVPVPEIRLPIGISFFTFQAMSYVIDVYRKEVRVQKNFGEVLLYISFFPQLIAGPIVKYHDVEQEITERKQNPEEVSRGIRRFIAGLSKKVLIANTMGLVADTLYGADPSQINILTAWMGAAAYMIQIYFDFSGYSDMAIGLGWMFGFHFRENFNYPYISGSIREFWRRWHISLSGWFREYLYITLGGNRKGKVRTCVNKFVVFLCTGIWHGANVTFLFWGIFHGCFLILEEYLPFFRSKGGKIKQAVSHVYVLLVVLIGFVFFRADTMGQGVFWLGQMFGGFHFEGEAMCLALGLLTPVNLAAFGVGVLASMPVKNQFEKIKGYQTFSYLLSLLGLVLCILQLAGGTYNPFIYFRF
ncbi:MAG: MBOAT family protein [Candidatus Limivivens sp.]|nr:MBOAT family protein [Candidatus Limivivens sp.]